MKEEYTVYPCSGKKYNGEKAIISLTSWKARINTVSKTLFSLLKMCPGFHIVLVLSEEEFPQREEELPEDLMAFVNNELIELLWVYNNYKSFKKVLFTMDKYKDIPIISADDDCIYTSNYAEELFVGLQQLKFIKTIIRYTYRQKYVTQGPCTLYNIHPHDVLFLIKKLVSQDINKSQDDDYISTYLRNMKYKMNTLGHKKLPLKFHDCIDPITPNQTHIPYYKEYFR